MPLIIQPIEEVKKHIDDVPMELSHGDITDVWVVIILGILLYFFSNFISLLCKVGGVLLVILGLYTIFFS